MLRDMDRPFNVPGKQKDKPAVKIGCSSAVASKL
jgi:hypothetical protein